VLASVLRGHARNAPRVLHTEADLVGAGLGDIHRRNLAVKSSVSQLASEGLGELVVEERIVTNFQDKLVEILI